MTPPAIAAQQVQAAVVADPGIGVGGHVVDTVVGQGSLGQGGPGQRRLGVAAYDPRGVAPSSQLRGDVALGALLR